MYLNYWFASYLAYVMTSEKTTLVLGASPNPERYSFLAIESLRQAGIPVLALGGRAGKVSDIEIRLGWEELENIPIDTITLYLGAERQQPHYDAILSCAPRRIIFNPGAENPELMRMATTAGIETLEACTLVMIRTGQY